jgi:type III secretion protein J
VDARVHIVLPENDPLSEYFQPSSASVFIKHRQETDIQHFIHPIKQLVVNSIEGLTYEKVSIVPFACTTFSAAPRQFVRIMGVEINAAYAARFKLLVMGLMFFLALLMISTGYLLWRRLDGRMKKASETPGDEAGDVLPV